VSPSGHQAQAVVEEKVGSVAASAGSQGKSRAAGIGAPTSNAVSPSAIELAERWRSFDGGHRPGGRARGRGQGVHSPPAHQHVDVVARALRPPPGDCPLRPDTGLAQLGASGIYYK
jgi:hypothetical protein